MIVNWSGPEGGLGNRMLGIASAWAIAQMLHIKVSFKWQNNKNCPAEYFELFQSMPGLIIDENVKPQINHLNTSGWDPINIFNGFKKVINQSLQRDAFLFEFIKAIKNLSYSEYVSNQFSEWKKNYNTKNNLAIHYRRTDRVLHHKNIFKRKKRQIFYIIQSAGLKKSLQYAFLSSSSIKKIEYNEMKILLRKYLKNNPESSYTLYCDSYGDLVQAEEEFKDLSFPVRYIPSFCSNKENEEIWGNYGSRKTKVQDALIDLLCMSNSNWIAQNNSASSFSLVASLIGGAKIITRKPTHNFWKEIANTFNKNPYDVVI